MKQEQVEKIQSTLIIACYVLIALLIVRYFITGSVFFGVESMRDVENLEKLIQELNAEGASVGEDLDNEEEYKWSAFTGRLIDIKWNDAKIHRETLSFEKFTGLQYLDVSNEDDDSDNEIKILDVSKNKNLKRLECSHIGLEKIDMTNNKKLKDINCSMNSIEQLDVSNNKKLQYLACNTNDLTKLHIGNLKKLKILMCNANALEELDVTRCKNLVVLECESNKIKTMDVSNNKKLKVLNCYESGVAELNLGKNTLDMIKRDEFTKLIEVNENAKIYNDVGFSYEIEDYE